MSADGSNQTRLTNDPGWDLFSTFSADGQRIAFLSSRDGNGEIYSMSADGSGQTRLTNNPAFDGWPAFSPDSSKIAFDSNRDGNDEIYSMNADGSGQARLTNAAGVDSYPELGSCGDAIAPARRLRPIAGRRLEAAQRSPAGAARAPTSGRAGSAAGTWGPASVAARGDATPRRSAGCSSSARRRGR